MNWLESLIYGIAAGFAEFLPISPEAHRIILGQIFGADKHTHLQDFLIHGALLAVLFYSCKQELDAISSNRSISQQRRRKGPYRTLEMRLLRTAAVPLLIGFLFQGYANNAKSNLMVVVLLFLLSGFILFLPDRMLQGNKTAGAMSGWDAILIGIFGALGIFPGLSRVGGCISAAVARGAQKESALNWALLLSIPALAVLMLLDIIGMFTFGFGIASGAAMFYCILAAAGAGLGGYFGIRLMRFLAVKTGISGFAYYCWGAALFTFILYLNVV